MVARLVRDQEAMGSSPVTSTSKETEKVSPFFLIVFLRIFYVTGLVPSSAEPPSLRRTPRAIFASTSTNKKTEISLFFCLIVFSPIVLCDGTSPSSHLHSILSA